jgi:PadR family transcriptional regulator, regulatory protein PadR
MSENLKKRTGGAISLLDGTLYNSLKQLEDLGLVRSYWEVQPNGRERRYYEILEEGRGELRSRLAQWQEFQSAMNAILPEAKG